MLDESLRTDASTDTPAQVWKLPLQRAARQARGAAVIVHRHFVLSTQPSSALACCALLTAGKMENPPLASLSLTHVHYVCSLQMPLPLPLPLVPTN